MLTAKHLSNKYSPVLTIEPGPVQPIATWLAAGFVLAGAGLLFNSLPAMAKLVSAGFRKAVFSDFLNLPDPQLADFLLKGVVPVDADCKTLVEQILACPHD